MYLWSGRKEVLLVVFLAVVCAVELLEPFGRQRHAAFFTFQATLHGSKDEKDWQQRKKTNRANNAKNQLRLRVVPCGGRGMGDGRSRTYLMEDAAVGFHLLRGVDVAFARVALLPLCQHLAVCVWCVARSRVSPSPSTFRLYFFCIIVLLLRRPLCLPFCTNLSTTQSSVLFSCCVPLPLPLAVLLVCGG